MTGRGVEFGYAAAWRLARTLPAPIAFGLARLAGDYAYRRGGPGTRRLAANLRRVVGPRMPEAELADLVRAGLRSYARYWMEAFRLTNRSRAQHLAGFRLDGEELLAADVAAGRGAVVALPHAANWDAAGAWVAAHGWRMVTVAERLKPEAVYARFMAFRESLGMEIVPATGGDRPPIDVLTEKLRQGYIVPLLADRDLSARGVEVEFFGGRTRMPPGCALLAVRTGAPLYVLHAWYGPDAVHARLVGPLPVPPAADTAAAVRALTQLIADELARGIAAHPRDWHMLQRLWLDEPAPAPANRP
ncbi:phosphatidylinositol mannoside acyltransferase [Rhizomonospora bruguierae]|uniref:phosphatidylinositol mannoside acyltransferase n=1 Tax=Rhizomonospora bruguierae TaxID=1581705 RepID=UPI0020C0D198|nr:phosphatidylinositol mannoside acyltransferase [Micromonospora sp. NBRC 107566]